MNTKVANNSKDVPAGPRPRAAMARVRGYEPGHTDERIDLKLDANEGPAAPGEVGAAARAVQAEVIRRYPAGAPGADKAELERLLAERLGIEPARALVTAGGDEALDRVCRAYLEVGREIVLPVPTFEMLRHYAVLSGAEVVEVAWWEGEFPVGAVLERASAKTAVIAVVSPNNPTGAAARVRDLERLAAGAPGALLLVDLAYTEFADEDLTAAALALPNAVVVRTLSKAWGMAGLRVGYAAAGGRGGAEIIGVLRKAGGPYSVAGPSIAAAREILRGLGSAVSAAVVARVRCERTELARVLRELGARPLESQANFVLARFDDATGVHARLAAQGIAVRRFGKGTGLETFLRITCPCDDTLFERLCGALRTATGGGGGAIGKEATA